MKRPEVVSIAIRELQETVERIVSLSGSDNEVAREVSRHLVRADQSGHSSHGVLRIPQYLERVSKGNIVPSSVPRELYPSQATVVLDCQFGYGHYSASIGVEKLLGMTDRTGVGVVSLRNSTHIGRLGEYGERIAGNGLVGIVVLGSAGPGVGAMRAFGAEGSAPFMNTNPWCIAVPSASGPVVFDAAMSTVAEGKVHSARSGGTSLPDDAILDSSGKPSNVPEDYYEGGSLVPLGGRVAGHKGSGLALMAALIGNLAFADGCIPDLSGIGRIPDDSRINSSSGGVTMLCIDPGVFGERDAYSRQIEKTVASLRSTGVIVPGDLERENRASNREYIELPRVIMDELSAAEKSLVDTY